MGLEAYGYIAVVLNLVSMVSIATIAITPMITRFITMSLAQRNYEEANQYFNTSLVASIVLSIVICALSLALALSVDTVFPTSQVYLRQIQILCIIVGLSSGISVLAVPFLASLYHTNDLYIYYTFMSISQVMRVIAPLIAFQFVVPALWIPYFGALMIDLTAFLFYVHYCRRRIPKLRIRMRNYHFGKLKEMVQSGIWSSVSKVGDTMIGGLNSYLTNLFLGTYMAGLYASFAQIQSMGAVLATTVAGSFVPIIYDLFATGDFSSLSTFLKKATKSLGVLLGVMSGCLLVFVIPFVTLWLGVDASQYRAVLFMLVTLIPLAYSGEVFVRCFMAANKLKYPALITVAMGALNIVLIVVFCFVLSLGLMGLVMAQTISLVLRALVFFAPYASRISHMKMYSVFASMSVCLAAFAISALIGFGVSLIILPDTWLTMLAAGVMTALISLFACTFIILSKGDRNSLVVKVAAKIRRKEDL
jgi:membrane protein EpsK